MFAHSFQYSNQTSDMSKGKPARIGIYFGGAIGDNAECCEFIGKHSIDFYITDFWNGPNETRFE